MARIIVVDLDGTLIRTDTLVESFFLYLRLFPLRFFWPLLWLMRGKVNLKHRLANVVIPDASSLPYNLELVKWLKKEHKVGAKLILATAADHRIAHAVFDHLGFFDDLQ